MAARAARAAQARPAGGGGAMLEALLRAERFRLGPRAGRVARNLAQFGGASDERAAAWIGADLPPLGAPSVTLAEGRGTLGPHSFGFLRNRGPVAAYAGALEARPRVGPIAIVCGRRDQLPDPASLAVARGLGVSWIISLGDCDPGPVLSFLAHDEDTRAVLIAATSESEPLAEALAALGEKPVVLLGGDSLARAAARRGGGLAAADLESWMAHGALLEAGVRAAGATRPAVRPAAMVLGGGATLLADAARDAGLALPILVVDDEEAEDPAELRAAIDQAGQAAGGASLLLLAGTPNPVPEPASAAASIPRLALDLGHPERVRAICRALAELAAPPLPELTRHRPEGAASVAAARSIRDAAAGPGDPLSDHDTKRVLKCYGARVSRQAPAGSPTAAARIAAQLGLPVDLASSSGAVRRATTASEVRRLAAVLIAETPGGAPALVMVREPFPPAPRARLLVRRAGPGATLGRSAQLGGERSLLPLDRPGAIALAHAVTREDPRDLIDLLTAATDAACELELDLDLDLHVGAGPAVIAASATRT